MRVLLLLLLLTGCLVPEFQPPEQAKEPIALEQQEQVSVQQIEKSAQPVKTVTYDKPGQTAFYGYDEQDRLVYVENSHTWTLTYDNENLVRISGPKEISFQYEDGRLTQINADKPIPFIYDRGRLVEVQAKETLHLQHDSKDLPRIVKRGVAGETSIDYDKQDKIKYLTRGSVQTTIYYDDKDRIRTFDGGDVNLLLGYWRDNQLIKLTGNTLGEGIEVSYGPETKPTTAQIISQRNKETFTSPETNILYKTVDLYLYCKYVRRLPVIFDGMSYAVFKEYYKKPLPQYFVQNILCEVMA